MSRLSKIKAALVCSKNMFASVKKEPKAWTKFVRKQEIIWNFKIYILYPGLPAPDFYSFMKTKILFRLWKIVILLNPSLINLTRYHDEQRRV